jgi:pyridoxamine 5'-phosphate oxidase
MTDNRRLQRIWEELARATVDRRHAWRYCVLATVKTKGRVDVALDEAREEALGVPLSAASARIVVLREVAASTRTLTVFTDSRSDKVAELTPHPHATLLFWHPRRMWQVRAQARVTILHEGERREQIWSRIKESPSSRDYLSALPPGAPLSSSVLSTEKEHHFAILDATVQAFDSLELRPDGHCRYRVEYRPSGPMVTELQP